MSNPQSSTIVYTIRAACAALALLWPTPSAAQVGHLPESSPYSDVRAKTLLSLTAGYTAGSGGSVGVGPAEGPMAGARVDLLMGGPVQLGVSAMAGNLDRTLIDPSQPPASRVVGKDKQQILFLEGSIGLVFTGRKTWHGLAPYIGGSLGLAFGSDVPADSLSDFEFKTKFTTAILAGTRWHVGRRLAFRFEVRDMLWQLRYPSSFFDTSNPDVPPVLDPRVRDDTEWTHNLQLWISLGYAIRI